MGCNESTARPQKKDSEFSDIAGEQKVPTRFPRKSLVEVDVGPLPAITALEPLKIDPTDVAKWGFDTIAVTADKSLGGPLYQIGYAAAAYYDLYSGDTKVVDEMTWRKFLKAIQAGYRNVPYHSATHAADVVASTLELMVLSGIDKKMTKLEQFAMIYAAAVHDYRHPGRSNKFLSNINDPVALRYNDQSVLEHFHVAMSFELMNRYPFLDVTTLLSPADYETWRNLVCKCVLGTDMAFHAEHLKKFTDEHKKMNFAMPADRGFALMMLLHAADVSALCKPLPVSSPWTKAVTEEFKQQGRDEVQRGLPVTKGCEETVDVPKSQVGFIDFVLLPLFKPLADAFKPLSICVQGLEQNKKFWANEKS